MRLIGAVFFGEYMLVHRKDDLKLCLGSRSVPFLKKRFVLKVDFVKVGPLWILKKKVLKILSKIVVISYSPIQDEETY